MGCETRWSGTVGKVGRAVAGVDGAVMGAGPLVTAGAVVVVVKRGALVVVLVVVKRGALVVVARRGGGEGACMVLWRRPAPKAGATYTRSSRLL
jgi:hypothetical protein